MKRQILLMLVMSSALWASPQVNVQVNIGAPPPVVLHSRPTMLYLAEPASYAAIGIPYDIFYVGDRYYYVRGDNWFWAPGYAGPWTSVSYSRLPPGLQKFKVVRLREFRDREHNLYVVQGAKFKGKHFKGEEHGRGRGRGKGK
jgi:hypothetical protein